MPVRSATLIQISGTSTPSRSRHAINTTELRLEDRVEVLRGQRLAELLQRARLELPHAFARQAERLSDLLERVLLFAAEAIAEPQDQLLARRQGADQEADAGAHPLAVEPVVGRGGGRVRDEVLEPLLGARDRRLERDRLAREQVERLERARVGAELGSELRRRRLAAQLAGELRTHALAALQPVVHVRGQPDRARVVLDRAHERLTDPPHRIGRKLEAAPVVELLDRADQAEVAFLDQVGERQAQVAVVLRDRDDELEVVLDEAILLDAHALVRVLDVGDAVEERSPNHLRLALEIAEALRTAAGTLHLLG